MWDPRRIGTCPGMIAWEMGSRPLNTAHTDSLTLCINYPLVWVA
jgi:hypothetical protein